MPHAQPPGTAHDAPAPGPLAPGRRAVMCALAAALLPRAALAATTLGTFPDGSAILVAGPDGGKLGQWAERIGDAMLDGLPEGVAQHRHMVGGADGVTGANQFETRVPPDGQTALLAPGQSALAWLVGDPRAQYDVARWLPIMAGITPGIVSCRLPAAALSPGAVLRLAAAGPVGPDLPGLLAVELLGLRLAPVFGLQDRATAQQALAAGAVDAVFIHGPQARQHAAVLAAAGAPPLFGMGVPGDDGAVARDPQMPELPTLPELAARLRGAPPSGPLYGAWQATAAAANLQFALVLPALTPAAMVALWRKAAAKVAAAPEVQAAAPDVRTLPAPGANTVMAAITAEAPTLLALRRWLGERLNWHPS